MLQLLLAVAAEDRPPPVAVAVAVEEGEPLGLAPTKQEEDHTIDDERSKVMLVLR